MRAGDFILLLLLFGAIGTGFYFLLDYTTVLSDPVALESFSATRNAEVYSNSSQFYSNLRYRNREISYSVGNACGLEQEEDIARAFRILSDETDLLFYRLVEDAEVNVLCSDIAPEPSEEGHFVAGEGGPSEIYDVGQFNVIFSGKVALYREERCDRPQIALHEIIHALGFDHNDNPNSIMHPLTNCNQEIDDYIIETLNELYFVDSLSDLVIVDLAAVKNGRFLNFDINISNQGLKDAGKSTLEIYSSDRKIKDFEIDELDIGVKRSLSVENMRVSKAADSFRFVISSGVDELNTRNNLVEVSVR